MKTIITNLPAFYKIRLYNEICKKTPLLVCFTNKESNGRNEDFYNCEIKFNYVWLNCGLVRKIKHLYKVISNPNNDELILGGWDSIEQYIGASFSSKKKNSLIVESTVYESSITGYKAFVKKLFLRRISKAYVAGELHRDLLLKLGFRGRIIISGGCGLLHYLPQPVYQPHTIVKKFLFVGRFIDEKNLPLLIEVFNSMPDLELALIGFGILEHELKMMAKTNIVFLGAIPNKELNKYYREADVFVLPSKSETWGLVVEEALNNGLPVIVSNRVGCQKDLVTDKTGLVFDYSSAESLRKSVLKMTEISFYNNLRKGVSELDFIKRSAIQIDCYA